MEDINPGGLPVVNVSSDWDELTWEELLSEARNYYRKVLKPMPEYSPALGEFISFPGSGIKKLSSKSAAGRLKLQSLLVFREIVSKAKRVAPPEKHSSNPNITAVHKIGVRVKSAADTGTLVLLINEDSNGCLYYTSVLLLDEYKKGMSGTGRPTKLPLPGYANRSPLVPPNVKTRTEMKSMTKTKGIGNAKGGEKNDMYELVIETPTAWRGDVHGEKLMQFIYRAETPLAFDRKHVFIDPSAGGAEVSQQMDSEGWFFEPLLYRDSRTKSSSDHPRSIKFRLYAIGEPVGEGKAQPVAVHADYMDWNGVRQSKALPLMAFIRRIDRNADHREPVFKADAYASVPDSVYKRISPSLAESVRSDAGRIAEILTACIDRHAKRGHGAASADFCVAVYQSNPSNAVVEALGHKLKKAGAAKGFTELKYVHGAATGKMPPQSEMDAAPRRTTSIVPFLKGSQPATAAPAAGQEYIFWDDHDVAYFEGFKEGKLVLRTIHSPRSYRFGKDKIADEWPEDRYRQALERGPWGTLREALAKNPVLGVGDMDGAGAAQLLVWLGKGGSLGYRFTPPKSDVSAISLEPDANAYDSLRKKDLQGRFIPKLLSNNRPRVRQALEVAKENPAKAAEILAGAGFGPPRSWFFYNVNTGALLPRRDKVPAPAPEPSKPKPQPKPTPPMPKARKPAVQKAKDDFKPAHSSQKLVNAIKAFKQRENLPLSEKDANGLYYRISEALLDAKSGDHFAPLGREVQRKLSKIRQQTAVWPTSPLRFNKKTSYKLMCFERDCGTSWNKIRLDGVASAAEVAAADFQTWKVPGGYGGLLGDVADGFHLVIWGVPGSGKSTFALGLANALAEVGPTLYVSAEEGAGATMQERLRRVGTAKNLFISGAGSVEQARKEIADGDFRFVVLDSVDTLRASVEDVELLKQAFPEVGLISIHQATKLGQMRGSLEYAHNADVIVRVQEGKAETTKNRYAPLGSVDVAFNGAPLTGNRRKRATKTGDVVSFVANGKRVEFCAKSRKGRQSRGRCLQGADLGRTGKAEEPAPACKEKPTSGEMMFKTCAKEKDLKEVLKLPITFKSKDAYAEITASIIEALEKNLVKGIWELPWTKRLLLPVRNPVTGREYRGFNKLLLAMEAKKMNAATNLFATAEQWRRAGFQVPRTVIKTRIRMTKPNGLLTYGKYVYLINSMWIRGAGHLIESDRDSAKIAPGLPKDLNDVVKATGADVVWGTADPVLRDRAAYHPLHDRIYMPDKKLFKDSAGLASTLAHELTHWTGHEKRLNRVFGRRHGDEAYAFEELIAELGATFICADYRIANHIREDHVKYLASWLGALKNNSRYIFEASSKAQAAVAHIYGYGNASLNGLECASCFDSE